MTWARPGIETAASTILPSRTGRQTGPRERLTLLPATGTELRLVLCPAKPAGDGERNDCGGWSATERNLRDPDDRLGRGEIRQVLQRPRHRSGRAPPGNAVHAAPHGADDGEGRRNRCATRGAGLGRRAGGGARWTRPESLSVQVPGSDASEGEPREEAGRRGPEEAARRSSVGARGGEVCPADEQGPGTRGLGSAEEGRQGGREGGPRRAGTRHRPRWCGAGSLPCGLSGAWSFVRRGCPP